MMVGRPASSACSRLGRSWEGLLNAQSQDCLLPVRLLGSSAAIMIQGKAQRRADLIFIERGEGKLHLEAALRIERQGPPLQTSPIQTPCSLLMAALSVIVCSHRFPQSKWPAC